VARLPGTAPTREQAIAAAVLALGPGALASHRAAAHLHGVPRPADDPVDVIVPQRTRGSSFDLANVVVHRPRDRLDLHPSWRDSIPCTNVLRTLCDLGAVDHQGVNDAVGHVLTSGLATASALDAALCSHSRRGRHGIVAFREAFRDWTIDGRARDSELERRMHVLARRYRLPPMEFHAVVIGYEVDFRVIGTPIVVECDGFAVHGRRSHFESDRVRDAELAAAGYVSVRITWRALTRRPRWVADVLTAAVARWRHDEPTVVADARSGSAACRI
jgi:very-short-patch-repair endonuclease